MLKKKKKKTVKKEREAINNRSKRRKKKKIARFDARKQKLSSPPDTISAFSINLCAPRGRQLT